MGPPRPAKKAGKKKPGREPQQVSRSGWGASQLTGMHAPPPAPINMHVLTAAPPSPARAQLTPEEHYENAEMAFAMDNFDLARASFKRALDAEPEAS